MDDDDNAKKGQWKKVAEHFQHITDGLGRPIDPPIFETVVALNVLGLPTSMSCGGHYDDGRGLLLPWVDIRSSAPHANKLRKKIRKLNKKAEKLRAKLKRQQKTSSWLAVKATEKKLHDTYKKIHPRRLRLRFLQSSTCERLVQLLTQFYEDRQVPFDRRLILHAWGDGQIRLSHQGGEDFYLASPDDLQRQKLEECRREMNAFTAFLKITFYGTVPSLPQAEEENKLTHP